MTTDDSKKGDVCVHSGIYVPANGPACPATLVHDQNGEGFVVLHGDGPSASSSDDRPRTAHSRPPQAGKKGTGKTFGGFNYDPAIFGKSDGDGPTLNPFGFTKWIEA